MVGRALVIGAGVIAAAKVVSDKLNDYKFITYTRTNLATGEVYSGRTSGFGDPGRLAAAREAVHPERLAGYGPAIPDRVAPGTLNGYEAIRGREQQLIDANGRAQSEGGTSGNLIRGVSKNNVGGRIYHEASNAMFGPLSPYTGN